MNMLRAWIDQHPVYTADRIIKRIEPYEYVSFDIFDTLIKRAVFCPEDVFRIAAAQVLQEAKSDLSPEDLARARIEAEKKARIKAGPNGEVTLEEIYQCLDVQYLPLRQSYLHAELNVERQVCHPNPVMKEVYDWCLKHEKRIIIISDMYLTRTVLQDLLTSCGYEGYEELFVSSEMHATKASGQIYTKVRQLMAIPAHKGIHIGDGIKRDGLRAWQQGFASVRIARNPNRTRLIPVRRFPKEEQVTWRKLIGLISGFENQAWNPYFQYGFEIVGPLLYGFCQWLQTTAKEQKIERLFFLARDGFLIQQAYNKMLGEDVLPNHYLYLSTKVARQAQMWLHSDLHEIASSFPQKTYLRYDEFCHSFGVNPKSVEDIWRRCGLEENGFFLPTDLIHDSRLMHFFEQVKDQFLEESSVTYQTVIRYLQQEGFTGKVAIVDIGWRGTIQHCLHNILYAQSEQSTAMTGYYLGLGKEIAGPELKFSFIPMSEEPNEFVAAFIEFPFSAAEGTVIGYSTRENMICPLQQHYEHESKEQTAIEQMQNGALHFIECAKGNPCFDALFDVNVAYAPMRRLSKKPSLYETRLFGDLAFYSGGKRFLAAPKKICYYIVHPRSFLYDLSTAGWKNAFLKRIFKVDIDYCGLLRLYKNATKAMSNEAKGVSHRHEGTA